MRRLSTQIALKIILIALLAIVGGLSVIFDAWWLMFICFFVMIYQAYDLYRLNTRIARQFTCFTDSIKFSESNISLTSSIENPAYREYYEALSQSVGRFNQLTRKREAEVGFYHTLLNRIDFGLIVSNEQQEIVWINKAALDMLGRPTPKHLNTLKEASTELYEALISLPNKAERMIKLGGGNKNRNLMLSLSLVSIRNEQFKIFSLKDIQPVVEVLEDSAWQQLIGVLTHEMMNSLAPIISLSDTFADPAQPSDPAMMTKAMQTIRRRSKGLVGFVNNYKRIAQIPKPVRQRVEVKPLVEDVVSLMASQKIAVETLLTSDSLSLMADRAQMEQVLINLLKNASEACAEQPDCHIKLTASEDASGRIVISISDNGCGILPDNIDRIFVPFYTTKPDGSGVGLSICRQIIALHGGSLIATSHPGKGSIFSIVI